MAKPEHISQSDRKFVDEVAEKHDRMAENRADREAISEALATNPYLLPEERRALKIRHGELMGELLGSDTPVSSSGVRGAALGPATRDWQARLDALYAESKAIHPYEAAKQKAMEKRILALFKEREIKP